MENDTIGGTLSAELAGSQFVYKYSSGRRYRLEFTAERVTFAHETEPGQWSPPGTVPYRARKLREGQFLVHWFGPGRTVHISLVIDLAERRVDVAALMPDKSEFFDSARFE